MPHALAVVTALLLFQPPAGVGTGPEPAPTPVSWEFEFRFLDPKRIEVQLPDSPAPQVYWYVLYTVINRGERSQMFFPSLQVVTEELRLYDSDMGISPLVFDAVKERHKLTHPYLLHPTRAIGELLRGDDNARESVAIWPQVDLSSSNFAIYVAGLSGESRFIRNPKYDPSRPETPPAGPGSKESAGNPKYFTLRKTLAIRYNLPGSPEARQRAQPERVGMRWIMR